LDLAIHITLAKSKAYLFKLPSSLRLKQGYYSLMSFLNNSIKL